MLGLAVPESTAAGLVVLVIIVVVEPALRLPVEWPVVLLGSVVVVRRLVVRRVVGPARVVWTMGAVVLVLLAVLLEARALAAAVGGELDQSLGASLLLERD